MSRSLARSELEYPGDCLPLSRAFRNFGEFYRSDSKSLERWLNEVLATSWLKFPTGLPYFGAKFGFYYCCPLANIVSLQT